MPCRKYLIRDGQSFVGRKSSIGDEGANYVRLNRKEKK
jgi:hypothetical protein